MTQEIETTHNCSCGYKTNSLLKMSEHFEKMWTWNKTEWNKNGHTVKSKGDCQTDSKVEKFVCNRFFNNELKWTFCDKETEKIIEAENEILKTIAVLEGFTLGEERTL